jgi:hypothetical protein
VAKLSAEVQNRERACAETPPLKVYPIRVETAPVSLHGRLECQAFEFAHLLVQLVEQHELHRWWPHLWQRITLRWHWT